MREQVHRGLTGQAIKGYWCGGRAWYRIISPTEIEIIGVGLLESANYAGFSLDSAARSVLENFVRQRIRDGVPIPNLDAVAPIALSGTPGEPRHG